MKCPFCDADIRDGARKCRFCGELLELKAADAARGPGISTAPPPAMAPPANPGLAAGTGTEPPPAFNPVAPGLSKSMVPPAGQDFTTRLFDGFLDLLRRTLDERWHARLSAVTVRVGNLGVLLAMVLGLLMALTIAVKMNSFRAFLAGVGWVCCLLVVQYIAAKFADSGDVLIKNTPTQLSSKAFLDCFALLNLLGSILCLGGGAYLSILLDNIVILALGVLFGAWAFHAGCLALLPGKLAVEIRPTTSAGEEAIGMMAHITKNNLAVVPLLYGYGVVAGDLLGVLIFANYFRGEEHALAAILLTPFVALIILSFALLPFLGYVTCVLSYLGIALMKAILAIPKRPVQA